MAPFVGTLEVVGGVALLAGLLAPLAGMLLSAQMAVAIWAVHWQNGFFNGDQGVEWPLAMLAMALAITCLGAGRYSLDAYRPRNRTARNREAIDAGALRTPAAR